jgi:predicted flavoprotein YhiN
MTELGKNRCQIIIIGGGASGFFAALAAKEVNQEASVCILERSPKLLGKVRISGGGRCNVTHDVPDVPHLLPNYPRGMK